MKTKDRNKVGKRSMRKGQDFERNIAKILSCWWGVNKSFARVPLSGGWKFTNDKKILGRITGDLITPEDFPFVISCKKVEIFEFHTIFSSKSIFRKWWSEIASIASQINKKPMLIFTRNRWDVFYCIFYSDWRQLDIGGSKLILDNKIGKLVIGLLKDFIKFANPKRVMTIGKSGEMQSLSCVGEKSSENTEKNYDE